MAVVEGDELDVVELVDEVVVELEGAGASVEVVVVTRTTLPGGSVAGTPVVVVGVAVVVVAAAMVVVTTAGTIAIKPASTLGLTSPVASVTGSEIPVEVFTSESDTSDPATF